jgi:tetratricopeptide (TPR) repeat protein
MSPENVKTIYRTFASQFRNVIVFSAEDLSSDTVLVGSDAPLALDFDHLAAGFRQPRVATELERAYVHSPYDLLARLLLTNRAEVMRYTEIEERLEGGRFRPHPAATNAAPCPAATCRRSPAPINTDDNALIEFAAPRDLIGFERYKGYLQTIYAADWPYGRLAGQVRGLDGTHGSERHAELAMALLAHGRKREAGEALERARRHGPSATLGLARDMFVALSDEAVEPTLGVSAPAPDPALTERSNERMLRGHAEVRDWLARGDPAKAKAALETIPASLLEHFGPSQRLLRGYVLYRNGEHDQVIGELEAIARTDPQFTRAHPELYFFLGRAHDALTHFDKAVRSIRAYVEAQPSH